jgi:hypothetical protein
MRTTGVFALADGFFLRRFKRKPLAGCAFACNAEGIPSDGLGLAGSLAGTWVKQHFLHDVCKLRCTEKVVAILGD